MRTSTRSRSRASVDPRSPSRGTSAATRPEPSTTSDSPAAYSSRRQSASTHTRASRCQGSGVMTDASRTTRPTTSVTRTFSATAVRYTSPSRVRRYDGVARPVIASSQAAVRTGSTPASAHPAVKDRTTSNGGASAPRTAYSAARSSSASPRPTPAWARTAPRSSAGTVASRPSATVSARASTAGSHQSAGWAQLASALSACHLERMAEAGPPRGNRPASASSLMSEPSFRGLELDADETGPALNRDAVRVDEFAGGSGRPPASCQGPSPVAVLTAPAPTPASQTTRTDQPRDAPRGTNRTEPDETASGTRTIRPRRGEASQSRDRPAAAPDGAQARRDPWAERRGADHGGPVRRHERLRAPVRPPRRR